MADLQGQVTFWENFPEPPDFDTDPMDDVIECLNLVQLPVWDHRKLVNHIMSARADVQPVDSGQG